MNRPASKSSNRRAESQATAHVWAVRDHRLHNDLLPRDCSRDTYYANATTTPSDVVQYLGTSHAVVALESRWAPRMLSAQLYCYELPAEGFRVLNAGAGYDMSEQSVIPFAVRRIENPMLSILERGVELRIMRESHPLR